MAQYNLKIEGEPQYQSSGCMLTVEEDYGHLATGTVALFIFSSTSFNENHRNVGDGYDHEAYRVI